MTKRGSLLPEFKNQPFELNAKLSEKARTQIDKFINGPEVKDPVISKHYLVGKQLPLPPSTLQLQATRAVLRAKDPDEVGQPLNTFINGPEDEDPDISKHYLVGKYGTKLGEIWAALVTVTAYKHKAANAFNTTTATDPAPTQEAETNQRLDIPIPISTILAQAIQAAIVVLPITRVLNLLSYCTQPIGSQPVVDFRTERQTMRLAIPGVDDPIVTIDEGSSYAEQVRSKDLPPEDSVVLLITRVLNLISYCTQPFGAQPVADFRTEQQKMSLQIPGVDGAIIAIDDGGLSLKVNIGPSDKPNVAIALLEAKRRLVVDHGKPKMSDECLAQMTCEAILARARSPGEQVDNERAIVINATSHYVCFLEFHVTATYFEKMNAGLLPIEPLKVTATHWFDLSDVKGRKGVLDNIRGLVGMALDYEPPEDDGDEAIKW
ncbi:hypothetical protein FPHYL_5618 [Fusarium phyllophilum]|uniref:Uncharacterized protein n=1 Tax=Fusarium phyllophilum TaxID=47803 RepID=A0A8H5NDW8_9HYPO|nr:hypothetical protein FPHYL_5618 [Fusarium phyllophilum]